MELVGQEVALGESVREWRVSVKAQDVTANYCTLGLHKRKMMQSRTSERELDEAAAIVIWHTVSQQTYWK